MGLGGFSKGSGITAAKFLLDKMPELIITDLKTETQLSKQVKQINKLATKSGTKLIWRLGGHNENDFQTADWVIRNPDVPPSNKFLSIARKRQVPIDNDITIFLRLYGAEKVVGVTGTRGKSTTTALTHTMLKNQFPQAKLGGNIGRSPLEFLPKKLPEKNKPPVILELSNFLLSDLPTIKKSPHIAVWTNLYPDHLNKYPSIKEYIDDKKNIFNFQTADDTAIFNFDNQVTREIGTELKKQNKNHVLFFSLIKKQRDGAYIKGGWFIFATDGVEAKVAKTSATKLFGEHNQANILAAICAARSFGAGWPAIQKAIKEFPGVPNRLETIYHSAKLTIVNDCTATSPQATMAALKSLPAGKIVLISGGNSKGSDLTEMAKIISTRAKAIIAIPGNATEDLLSKIKSPKIKIQRMANFKEAVETGLKATAKGDYLLLSPGLTWLPLLNEFERGKQFKKMIKKMLK